VIDPVNTTDGRPCVNCGDDADGLQLLQGHMHPSAFCGSCLDHVELCPSCEQHFWGPDGYRIYRTSSNYCPRCALQHPEIVVGREWELRRDEARDEMNDRRR
jgi:hypothetical protein